MSSPTFPPSTSGLLSQYIVGHLEGLGVVTFNNSPTSFGADLVIFISSVHAFHTEEAWVHARLALEYAERLSFKRYQHQRSLAAKGFFPRDSSSMISEKEFPVLYLLAYKYCEEWPPRDINFQAAKALGWDTSELSVMERALLGSEPRGLSWDIRPRGGYMQNRQPKKAREVLGKDIPAEAFREWNAPWGEGYDTVESGERPLPNPRGGQGIGKRKRSVLTVAEVVGDEADELQMDGRKTPPRLDGPMLGAGGRWDLAGHTLGTIIQHRRSKRIYYHRRMAEFKPVRTDINKIDELQLADHQIQWI
ncbi:hypothetical protein MKZ38_006165 [Zalerion maritima]|uniref:Uncharacterized protein n=1 Tax=Zalerion maritima TaxID=339359 RepID=A0AAD5WQH3_9PEZI|nr:hypothetical protein MKZ38_006165 [Zalerion maritima]